MEINENREAAETNNDELFVDAENDALPPQDAMPTTTAATAEDGRGDGDDDEADDTKGGEEGGAIWRSKMETTKKRR